MVFPLIRFLHTSCTRAGSVNKKLLAGLRQKTGYPIIQCRTALNRFENDPQAAEEWLREEATKHGWVKIEKLAKRPMSQGLVGTLHKGSTAILVEVNCETDFVARTPVFHKLVHNLAHSCLKALPKDSSRHEWTADQLETLSCSTEDASISVSDLVALTVGELGEKVAVRRAVAMSAVSSTSILGSYSHAPWHDAPSRLEDVSLGRYATLAHLELFPEAVATNRDRVLWSRQLCQHIVGLMPSAVGIAGVDTPNYNRDEEKLMIFQDFLLDESVTVGHWLAERGLTVTDFVRWQYGEVLPGDS